jgi:small-conductance mechanosensitive channel
MRNLIALFFILSPSVLTAQSAVREAVAVENVVQTDVSTMVNKMAGNNLVIRFIFAAVAVVLMVLLSRLAKYLFQRLHDKAATYDKIKPVTFKQLTLIEPDQSRIVLALIVNFLKYVAYALIIYLTLPIVFGLFEPTRELAVRLIGYILTPLKRILLGILNYIPNVIGIIVTLVVMHYAIKVLRYFSNQIESEKLVIKGFYPDWAPPTFSILRILTYVFTLIIIYPMLPHSDSAIFQGVSVFVGLLVSLGSTSFIGNIVAGIVVTYMRPFKIGDRIKIGEITGFVVEKNATVTRLRTHKNEYVTFPNSSILNSNITNYNLSADNEEDHGLILNTVITFGYTTPWKQVHEILINAALKTDLIERDPFPFVQQTKLDDFYAHYEINAYTKAVNRVPYVYSELYKHIQDGFREAGLDMTVSYYRTLSPYIDPFKSERQSAKGLE